MRELMERHGLKYVSGPLLTQAASVYVKVVELSLPNKVPGRRRRDMIRLAAREGLADPEPGPLQLTQSRGASRPEVVQLLRASRVGLPGGVGGSVGFDEDF